MEQRRSQSFAERLLSRFGRWEKPLLRTVMFGVVLVILVQLVYLFPAGRQALIGISDPLSADLHAGSVTATAGQERTATILIKPIGDMDLMPDAKVLVNGVTVASFTQTQVSVRVHEGDTVSIDTSAVPGVHRFQIDLNDSFVASPVPGQLVESDDDVNAVIGPVQFLK